MTTGLKDSQIRARRFKAALALRGETLRHWAASRDTTDQYVNKLLASSRRVGADAIHQAIDATIAAAGLPTVGGAQCD